MPSGGHTDGTEAVRCHRISAGLMCVYNDDERRAVVKDILKIILSVLIETPGRD